jgi:hypothetical protein
MTEPNNIEGQVQTHHTRFDEALQNRALEDAKNMERKASLPEFRRKKTELLERAESYYRAVDEIKDFTKAEAVDWIQENAGGQKGSEMSNAGEHMGVVWSRQTACDTLSTWKEIFTTVADIIAIEDLNKIRESY